MIDEKKRPAHLVCAEALRDGDLDRAKRAYEAIEGSKIAFHLALGGRVFLASGDIGKAKKLFEEAKGNVFSTGDNRNTRYIAEYVDLHLKVLNGEKGVDDHVSRAIESRPHLQVFLTLPIFSPEENSDAFLLLYPEMGRNRCS